MANTVWSGNQANRLYVQSGGTVGSAFSATLKSSAAAPSTTPHGMSFDGTNSPNVDTNTNKMYENSGGASTISATIKTSISISAIESEVRECGWDGANSPWCGSADDKLYTQSGQFSATLKTSLSVGAVDTTPNGVSYDGTNSPWAGEGADKMYLQSGAYSTTLKTSRGTPDGGIKALSWDGTDSPVCTNTGDILYRVSGQFSATIKSSLDVTSVDTTPTGIDTVDTNARLGLGGGTIVPIIDGQIRRRHAALPIWAIPVFVVGQNAISKDEHPRREFFKRAAGLELNDDD